MIQSYFFVNLSNALSYYLTSVNQYYSRNSFTAKDTLTMSYDDMWRITSKSQQLSQTGVMFSGTLNTGYSMSYHYNPSWGRHFQIKDVAETHYRTSATPVSADNIHSTHSYSYDPNGNLAYESVARRRNNNSTTRQVSERKLLWDSQNRLRGISDNGYVSLYWYDADGNRTVKEHLGGEAAWVNSAQSGQRTDATACSIYPNAYISISGNRWTKHYYIGSERIASRTGTITSFNSLSTPDKKVAGYGLSGVSVNYGAMCGAQEDSISSIYAQFGVPYEVHRTSKRGDAYHLYLPIGRTEEKDNDTAETSENNPQRNHPNTLGDGKVYFYHRDHLGSTMSVTDSLGQVAQTVEYTPTGEVFVEQQNDSIFTTPYLFNGKELDEETGLYYYGARYYDPRLSVWYSTDPMQEKYPWVTTYGYCMNNPVKFKEPFGEEPVYDKRGKFLGATSEGFKGDILIYSGRNNINFGKMTRKELFEQYRDYIETLDMELSFAAGGIDKKYLPKIWTHIVSHFEGLQVYDEKFTLSSIANGRIYYNPQLLNDPWITVFSPDDPSFLPAIFGSGNNLFKYENTVENIASSIIVHEWYSHGMKHTSDKNNSHRLAYKNVINYKYLWNKTTDKYKYFNLYNLWYYTNKETGRNNVDPQYRNLYRKYVGK